MSIVKEALYSWAKENKILLPSYPPAVDSLCCDIINKVNNN